MGEYKGVWGGKLAHLLDRMIFMSSNEGKATEGRTYRYLGSGITSSFGGTAAMPAGLKMACFWPFTTLAIASTTYWEAMSDSLFKYRLT